MITSPKNVSFIDGATLVNMRLPPVKYCVDTLLPQGLAILGGAPKTGKSWLVLDLCARVSEGKEIWNMPTTKGTVLYLAFEDTKQRIQQRLFCISADELHNVNFVTEQIALEDGLCNFIRNFVEKHPDTVLVAIDTLQMIRHVSQTVSYGNDYDDIGQLKQLADSLGITILVVHHLRKQPDNDPINMISGTTGIVGSADAVYVLTKAKRTDSTATLYCTGRDIEQRQINLKFENCKWSLVSDSFRQPEKMLPPIMEDLVWYMRQQLTYTGSNSEFASRFNAATDNVMTAQWLKQQMNKYRFDLEPLGVFYKSCRSNSARWLEIKYLPPVVADGDARDASDKGAEKYRRGTALLIIVLSRFVMIKGAAKRLPRPVNAQFSHFLQKIPSKTRKVTLFSYVFSHNKNRTN